MNTQKPFLGKLEKDVMERIWANNEPVTVRILYENINKERKIAYTTVMTIVGRLAEKGLLKKRLLGQAYLYKAVYTKDKFLSKTIRQTIKDFVFNFGDAAVAHFAEEIERIPTPKKTKFLKMLKDAK